jgi:hypothetical protein
MRKQDFGGGRSINLALSNRGLKALHAVGLDDAIRKSAVPMHGRMIHPMEGDLNFQPYGKAGQFINSISRSGLNAVLMDEAERLGVEIFFESKVENIDLSKTQITYNANEQLVTNNYQLIVGTDGAYSTVRNAFQLSDRFNYAQHYIEHGYKELTIPAGADGKFLLEKNALHIWPRESFMLIALPNLDGSFTCTLFSPFNGPLSFDTIRSKEDVLSFFKKYFPDVIPLMPTLLEDFVSNPTSSLVTIHAWPWYKNNSLDRDALSNGLRRQHFAARVEHHYTSFHEDCGECRHRDVTRLNVLRNVSVSNVRPTVNANGANVRVVQRRCEPAVCHEYCFSTQALSSTIYDFFHVTRRGVSFHPNFHQFADSSAQGERRNSLCDCECAGAI